MKASIIPIGNSKGIRIPKAVLKQCEVELEVEKNRIIIKPVKRIPRRGWERAFREMAKRRDDRLIIADDIDADVSDWEWR
jgi:antitoxin MazE